MRPSVSLMCQSETKTNWRVLAASASKRESTALLLFGFPTVACKVIEGVFTAYLIHKARLGLLLHRGVSALQVDRLDRYFAAGERGQNKDQLRK